MASSFFDAPSSGPPVFGTDPYMTSFKQGLMNFLSQNQPAQTTQQPNALQNTAAQALSGMFASNFGTGYQTGQQTLEELAKTGGNIQAPIQAYEQSIRAQLPYTIAQNVEQYGTGLGSATDLASAIARETGVAEKNVAAAVAPALLQAQLGQSQNRLTAGTNLGQYSMLPGQLANQSILAGKYMQPTLDPWTEAYLGAASRMIPAGTASAPQTYGQTPFDQLMNAIVTQLAWSGIFGTGAGVGGAGGGGVTGGTFGSGGLLGLLKQGGTTLWNQLFPSNPVPLNADPNSLPWEQVFDWGGDVMPALSEMGPMAGGLPAGTSSSMLYGAGPEAFQIGDFAPFGEAAAGGLGTMAGGLPAGLGTGMLYGTGPSAFSLGEAIPGSAAGASAAGSGAGGLAGILSAVGPWAALAAPFGLGMLISGGLQGGEASMNEQINQIYNRFATDPSALQAFLAEAANRMKTPFQPGGTSVGGNYADMGWGEQAMDRLAQDGRLSPAELQQWANFKAWRDQQVNAAQLAYIAADFGR